MLVNGKFDYNKIDGLVIIESAFFDVWDSRSGPPVPVSINKESLDILIDAVWNAHDPVKSPRVFRLYMKRGMPRQIVSVSEIAEVWVIKDGGIRWKEGGYPSVKDPIRKGGNCFIRGDLSLSLRDAWWMGREQTDLRILIVRQQDSIKTASWWSRGDSGKNGTGGDLWPVKLNVLI